MLIKMLPELFDDSHADAFRLLPIVLDVGA